MRQKFIRERVRFDTKQPHTLVIQGWLDTDSAGKKAPAVFVAELDGAPARLELQTQSGVEVTKKYLRYRTQVEEEYFLRIPLGQKDSWASFEQLRVYQLPEEGARTCIFHASLRELKKLSGHLESWVEALTLLPDGRYQLRGWYMGSSRVQLALLTSRGKEWESDCTVSPRVDLLGEFPEAALSETYGFSLTFAKPEENFLRLALKGGGKKALYVINCRKLLSGREGLLTIGKKSIRYLQRKGFRQFAKRVTDVVIGTDSVSYEHWRKKYGVTAKELEAQRHQTFAWEPEISIVVPLYRTPEKYLRELIASVQRQTYPRWQLVLSDGSGADSPLEQLLGELTAQKCGQDGAQACEGHVRKEDTKCGAPARKKHADQKREEWTVAGKRGDAGRILVLHHQKQLAFSENTNAAIHAARGEFLAFVDHDDLLAPDALYECVRLLNEHPDAELIYTDEDKVDGAGRKYFQPHFKPDYNPDLLCSMNYFCHLVVVKRSLQERVGLLNAAYDGAQDYDFVLRCTEQTTPGQICHIPKVLYHWRTHAQSTAENPESKRYAFQAGCRAIQAHYDRLGIPARVREGQYPGLYESDYEIQGEPLVSILIPNKDHLEDLRNCIRSIEEQSDYRNYEYVIIENNSEKPETFAGYEALVKENPKVRIVTYEGAFNFSDINNFGVQHASGEYYLLLNNDTEMIRPDGLRQLLGYCQRPEVGIVGARLYYGDDTIQHAGVVLGFGGIAGHAFIGQKRGDNGYFSRILCAQEYSAVTAACMMVKASVYHAVGGMSADLRVAFNDIDFCMKVREAGWLVVYNPRAELYHYESKSRGLEDTPEKIERFNREMACFLSRWGEQVEAGDPYYSPNLTLDKADFSIKW